MGRRNRHKRGGNWNISRIKAMGGTLLPSTTNATGISVIDRWEIDTSLLAIWNSMATVFQKWRIRRLRFEFVTNRPTSQAGTFAMAVLEDPDSVTPAGIADVVNNRVACSGHAYQNKTLNYTPAHVGWLYTKDGGISDDRFEMPGDFVFCTSSFEEAVSPGTVFVHFEVEFSNVTNNFVSKVPCVVHDHRRQEPDDCSKVGFPSPPSVQSKLRR